MYQFVSHIIEPSTLLYLLMCLALVILWKRADLQIRKQLRYLTILFLAWGLLSTPASIYLASGTLEWHFPPRYDLPPGTRAIVVLGGGISNPDGARKRPDLGESSIVRCLKAAELYREHGPCAVMVCGGRLPNDPNSPAVASVMMELLRQSGVARQDIIVEDRSQSTHENVVEAIRLLRENGIRQNVVVVTSAFHLLRAERCFQKQGLPVTPIGCAYRATRFRWMLPTFLPSAAAASRVDDIAHEWIGMIWYWLRGRI